MSMSKQTAVEQGYKCVVEQKNSVTGIWEREYSPQTLYRSVSAADDDIRRMQAGWSDSVRDLIQLRIAIID
jgi:hypothetical protein